MNSPVLAVLAAALIGVASTGCGGPSTTPPASPAPSTTAERVSEYASPVMVGRIETTDIRESSGLSASDCQDVLWTHNDSGNDALVFAMDTTGKGLGTWRVGNARNVDWESIATYKDPGGRCSLVIADIGDNDEARGELEVYRIPEPTASAATAGSTADNPLPTEPAQVLRFRYPDGNNNAETILVHPRTGDLYVVTKEESGPAGVFRMPPAFDSGAPVTGEKVADIAVPADPEGRFTGGSMSPDGRRVMLCDLEGGYELVLPDGATDPDAIWRQQPTAVDLGDRPQGEGVSYARDGLALFASSEKKNAPLFRIERRS
jgi:hypothetical protein